MIGICAFKFKDTPGSEFKILGYGRTTMMDGKSFDFTYSDATIVVAAFKARGIDFLCDWEHQSIAHRPGFEQFKSPTGKAPAAGWGALEARADGLYATGIQWTEEAQQALKSGEYRYYSPVIVWGPNGRPKAIQSVALTNEPMLTRINAIAAKNSGAETLLGREPDDHIAAYKAHVAFAPDRLALHEAALALQRQHPGTEYAEAVDAAAKGIMNLNDLLGDSRKNVAYKPNASPCWTNPLPTAHGGA